MESTAVHQGQVYVGMDKLSFEFIQVAVGNKIGFVSPERRYEAPTVVRPPQM